jgi:hypothetical protein
LKGRMMSEYKTKEIEIPHDAATVSLAKILSMLPDILRENDEIGWEVCGTLAAQFYTSRVVIGVVYRKVPLPSGYIEVDTGKSIVLVREQ